MDRQVNANSVDHDQPDQALHGLQFLSVLRRSIIPWQHYSGFSVICKDLDPDQALQNPNSVQHTLSVIYVHVEFFWRGWFWKKEQETKSMQNQPVG